MNDTILLMCKRTLTLKQLLLHPSATSKRRGFSSEIEMVEAEFRDFEKTRDQDHPLIHVQISRDPFAQLHSLKAHN
ncbi:hypothetical protein RRG08_003374 [Elysia crispata]|uniref:Uncharacterized protein n=1 Tax=Elysia crispata TaxID=231223 RepID=A0AAE1AC63_9GAST|nr:hypothetical protein RRG08_003374 [Elysia crispata]